MNAEAVPTLAEAETMLTEAKAKLAEAKAKAKAARAAATTAEAYTEGDSWVGLRNPRRETGTAAAIAEGAVADLERSVAEAQATVDAARKRR